MTKPVKRTGHIRVKVGQHGKHLTKTQRNVLNLVDRKMRTEGKAYFATTSGRALMNKAEKAWKK